MKKIYLIFSILLTGIALNAQVQFEKQFSNSLKRAKIEKKLIFIDTYAAWHNPSKEMLTKVFTDPKLSTFFNANFVNLKIDINSAEGNSLQSKYSINTVPTILFLDANGKVIFRKNKYHTVEEIIQIGKVVLNTYQSIK